MNRYLMTTTSLLAGAALVLGGGALAADAATATPAASPTSSAGSCTFGEHLVSVVRGLPKALRDDLKKARAEAPGADRRKDIRAITTKALDGGYGAGVESTAKFLKSHRGDIQGIRPLPDALTADLKTLRSETTRTAKVAEANRIADKAIAGSYGAKVQTLAKDVKAGSAWQDCSPAASGS